MKFITRYTTIFFFALVTLIIALVSCSKDAENSEVLSGKYKGIFTKGTDTANVQIEFDKSLFSGTSDKSFPQVCNGQVLQQKDLVYFTNTCSSVGSIDVLSGNYFYYQKDNYLSFWKTINGVTAYYRLYK